MSTFSAAALSARCQSIHDRVISAAAGIGESAAQRHASDSPLIQLSAKLRELGEAALQLGSKLSGTEPISQDLQNAIKDRLEKCASAEAIVEEGTAVSKTRLLPISQDLLSKYSSWASLETSAMESLVEALEMKTTDGQNKLLSGPEYRALIGIADTAFMAVISSQTGPSGMESEAPPPLDDEPPPPYDEDTSEHVSDVKQPEPVAPSTASPSSSKSAPPKNLVELFRAVTASFRQKPKPLVAALCEACARGDIKNVTALVSNGADINGRNQDGKTPLVVAIENRQLPVFTELLELGASKDVKDSAKKMPPLFWAASVGDLQMAKVLLQHGCKPNQKNMYGHAYFLDVIDKGDVDMVQLLLDHGAKANTTDLYGRPAIHHAYSANNLAMLKLLQSRGGSVNASDMTGCPMIILALQENKDDILNFLIEYGANVNATTATGLPLVVEAFTRGRIDVVKTLLERGADANAKDLVGSSMLMNAAKSDKLEADARKEVIKALLNHGAKPNDRDAWGKSVVSFIVERGTLSLVPLLLENGLDPNQLLSNGETLLEYAARTDNQELVREIFSYGARRDVGIAQVLHARAFGLPLMDPPSQGTGPFVRGPIG
ncbi:hypothetical protein KVR01_004346 [Diaporthe batatas]|uniref:uncharacterized protein n=1 Tax=Diaporthe batatas TaxID=748121 RepID=UPI001D043DE1|nr:uncharacterized protein KVR01_004346 [Diaporthe batatas]KAG8165794.1 hypothetical protein KVR01_004346 [Diaporthe batatas]